MCLRVCGDSTDTASGFAALTHHLKAPEQVTATGKLSVLALEPHPLHVVHRDLREDP